MPEVPYHKLFIGGEWVDSKSGETFEDRNPADTGDIIGVFAKAGPEDVRAAVDAAEEAFPKWSAIPAPQRARVLFRTVRILQERKEELAKLMAREMGKQLSECRGDVQEAIDIFEYCAGEGRRMFGRTTTSELREKFAMSIRKPIGVCALVTPWNFPLAIPSWKAAPALVAGNTVVMKPASDTPLMALKLAEVLVEAGLPKGVMNLVFGPGVTTGKELVLNRKVRCVSFTGHRDTGTWIAGEAGKQLKRVSLELGSKNPIIVMDDADLDLAVKGITWGAFGTTGQRCTAASRVIVTRKVRKALERKLIAAARRIRVGPALEGGEMGPLINERQLQKVAKYVEIGRQEGARLVLGGEIAREGRLARGFFYRPTIFTEVDGSMRIAQEEIFGPVLSIIPCKSLDDAIEIANSVEYGLSTSIYTRDINNAFRAIERLEAGITYVNAPTIGAEVHLPFGGVKASGYGREAGWTAIEEFTEEKAVYVDYSGKLQRAQIDIG